jgi:hypothetical protein
MRRRNFLKLGPGAIGGALAACAAEDGALAAGAAEPLALSRTVSGWNDVALQAIHAARPGPLAAAHALVVLHTSMYNAWAAYDDDARQTAHGVAVRLPRAERSAASKVCAMSHAACLALGHHFPAQRAAFDARMVVLGLDPAAVSGQFTPAGIGRSQAASMLDSWRAIETPEPAADDTPDPWWRLAHQVSKRGLHGDDDDVRLFFVLANALFEAAGAARDPVQAQLPGPAVAGAAAAEVLRRFTGSDRLGTGSATFSQAALREGMHGAEHVATEVTTEAAALALGREVGGRVFGRASRYWQGKF